VVRVNQPHALIGENHRGYEGGQILTKYMLHEVIVEGKFIVLG
jgi:hypothetical protein